MMSIRLRLALVGAFAVASQAALAAQITVVKPLDPIPPRRLAYHPPRLISCPDAQYPDSLHRRIGGRVVLEVVVDTLGRVRPQGLVVRESPHRALSQAATHMALRCRFAPARLGQTAVQKVATISVDFTIGRRQP